MWLNLRQTPVTALLLAAIAGVFVLETVSGGSTNDQVLLALGANYGPRVVQGEWWRLLSSLFLHSSVLHLLMNGWALYQLGGLFERWVGPWRMLGVYFASGLAGSVASLLWTRGLSVGASGAIFGVLGALITFLLRRRGMLLPYARSLLGQLVMWAVINIALGFSIAYIDNAAHLGGLTAGLVLGLVLKDRRAAPRPALPV